MQRSLKVLFHIIRHAFPDDYVRTMVWKAELEWGSMTFTMLESHFTFTTLSLTIQSDFFVDIINTPQTAVQVASLIHSLGEPIIFAESFGCFEGGVATRSKMNQIAICHNWTSKSSERNSETLELWGFYFMSQSFNSRLHSPVQWTEKIAVILSHTLVVSLWFSA